MRSVHLGVAISFLFALLACPLHAQSQQGTTVGLGFSATQGLVNSNAETASASPMTFSVPITFSSVRIEPEIGYAHSNRSDAFQTATTSRLLLGTGVFYAPRTDDFRFQAGARVGVHRSSIDYEVTREDGATWESPENVQPDDFSADGTSVDFSVGPAVGGEYYVSDHLSLGVEARLIYTQQNVNDDTVVSVDLGSGYSYTDGTSDVSSSTVNTEGAAYLRVHF